MTHLSMDQLLAVRGPGAEPGDQAIRAHLEECAVCQAEADRLSQRVARLKALPSLRPARSQFPAVRHRLLAERRRQVVRGAALGGLALAASIAAVALIGPLVRTDAVGPVITAGHSELQSAIAQSKQLEAMLRELAPERRALDGRTAALAARIEDQIMLLDRQLEVANGLSSTMRTREQVRLWRERAGLLNALMDVHTTQARFAGL